MLKSIILIQRIAIINLILCTRLAVKRLITDSLNEYKTQWPLYPKTGVVDGKERRHLEDLDVDVRI